MLNITIVLMTAVIVMNWVDIIVLRKRVKEIENKELN